MDWFFSNLADIEKVMGGMVALAITFYIGFYFFRKQSDFSGEYDLLIDQYKIRNEELQVEIDNLKNEINTMRATHQAEIMSFKVRIETLEQEILNLTRLLLKP